jgi:hypothetical protein
MSFQLRQVIENEASGEQTIQAAFLRGAMGHIFSNGTEMG